MQKMPGNRVKISHFGRVGRLENGMMWDRDGFNFYL